MAGIWGGVQRLAGPFLTLPYHELSGDGVVERTATFLAADLQVTADLATERLRRGLFEAPVYRSTIELSGTFYRPDFAQWGVTDDQVLWDQGKVSLEVSDVRAIDAGTRLQWAEDDIAFQPGSGKRSSRAGIHVRLLRLPTRTSWPFFVTLAVSGSVSLHVAPAGEVTVVSFTGDWPDPSFGGAWLPTERELRADGFSASWLVSHVGRGYPQSWRDDPFADAIDTATVGVELLTPVDPYRQAVRSLKYSLLFLALTFGTVWLFEVLSGARLHLIHFALIGAAMCLFYLLELALSEHLGFGAAYAIAACAVVVTTGAYAKALLSGRRALLLAGVLVALYAGMYVLLQLAEYALLAGSLALLLILAGIMYATRTVDWHAAGSASAKAGGEPR